MTVRKYSLKFVKLWRYETSLVSKSRDEISRFLIGITEGMEEECRAAMLHDIMDLSREILHVQRWRTTGRRGASVILRGL